jgi:hypothetical protein
MSHGCLHRVFTETDFRPELRKISVPTLLIQRISDDEGWQSRGSA